MRAIREAITAPNGYIEDNRMALESLVLAAIALANANHTQQPLTPPDVYAVADDILTMLDNAFENNNTKEQKCG